MLAQGLGGCKSPRRAITAPSSVCIDHVRRSLPQLAILLASVTLLLGGTRARAEWLAPLTVETAATIPSGQIDFALGASYFHNRRFPPFTPEGFINWQDLTAVPELALRGAVGDMVEIQASYEFLNLA